MLFLSGGGLDSAAYIILQHKNIDSVLSIDYGQVGYDAELIATRDLCAKYNIEHILDNTNIIKNYNKRRAVSLFTGNSLDDAYVNGRNLMLIMLALQYDNNVMLGFTNPGYEPFPDANPMFIDNANEILNKVFKNDVSIVAPYQRVLRTDLLKQAYLIDDSLFDMAMTCWTPINGKECGKCKHCKLKQQQKELVLKELEIEIN